MAVVVTWNVAGRVRTVEAQAHVLSSQPADVVALQEIRLTSMGAWRQALEAQGFAHILTSHDEHDHDVALDPDRRLGVLVAAREPLAPLPAPELPWPERYLAARTTLDGAEAEIHNFHSPTSNKAHQVKVRTLEAIHNHLTAPSELPRVLVGDFNTPQYESREGEVRSFARTRSGNIRPHLGERHDRAELSIVPGIEEHGYVDAFRVTHGYSRRDRSWMYGRVRMGWRLDHIFVRGLEVTDCDYRHDWREHGLSDHSGMWAALEPK